MLHDFNSNQSLYSSFNKLEVDIPILPISVVDNSCESKDNFVIEPSAPPIDETILRNRNQIIQNDIYNNMEVKNNDIRKEFDIEQYNLF